MRFEKSEIVGTRNAGAPPTVSGVTAGGFRDKIKRRKEISVAWRYCLNIR